MHSDTAPVRSGEELNLAALADFLRGKVEGMERGITVEQFPNGHSNLTYLLRMNGDGREYVLRRAPLGPVAPKAHDMAREYRVLQMVHPYFREAPDVFHLCEDSAVLGAVFFLMERRHGLILRDDIPRELATVPNYPELVSEAFIDCLVRLHAIDVSKTGLIALGKPDGFLERQVQGWADRWNRSKTDDMPKMERVIRWLVDRRPSSSVPTLVHNDYKLDNVILRDASIDRVDTAHRIEAVLDWEMATVGDPLADLGLTLCYWAWVEAPQVRARGVHSLTSQPGWYTRDQFVQRYGERTGRDLSQIGYYEVLGMFKLAVILQQIYYRFRRGQTQDMRFQNFGEQVRGLVELADSLAGKLS
ncbi:MAG TPA: phosphotransferase family protein [Candidatus Sulfotelmatobacter sp.]|nr:phosphotransferase family protein [Candidatus Sulfotelmatobacter sp.]